MGAKRASRVRPHGRDAPLAVALSVPWLTGRPSRLMSHRIRVAQAPLEAPITQVCRPPRHRRAEGSANGSILVPAPMTGQSESDEDGPVRRTVVIVDDHDDFRAAARDLLEADGFAVLGEAADGAEAIAQVALLQPTIVLLDIQLPGPDGFAVAERLAAEFAPPPLVVLISSREAASYGDRITRSTARGFIAKRRLSGAELTALVD